MRYRKLSASGDYVFGNGKLDFFLNTPQTVAQAVLTRLKLWYGEFFLDPTDGTPYLEDVLGKRYAGKNYDAVIKQRILNTTGVKSLAGYQSNYDGTSRKLTVQCTIDTDYGTATVQANL